MIKYFKFLIISFVVFACNSIKTTENSKNYKSEDLVIQKIANHVYQHTSFLDTKSFGKVPCNGMIVFDKNEAIIFDTPPDNNTALALINWVEDHLNCKIKAIIPTHFHTDCLGGLDAFHKHHIPSYANNLTVKLAKSNNLIIPQNGFDSLLELKVGNKKVIAEFAGEGHTKDNIIGYFPDENIMFGGCLIKALGAKKGNLADANVKEWALTAAKLREKYPNTKVIIPGHGALGGIDLLDYTIKLFARKQ